MSDNFDIEDLFRDGFSDHEEQPSENLFAKIESSAESEQGIVARYKRAFKEWDVMPSAGLYQKISWHYWFKKLFVPSLLTLLVFTGSTLYVLNSNKNEVFNAKSSSLFQNEFEKNNSEQQDSSHHNAGNKNSSLHASKEFPMTPADNRDKWSEAGHSQQEITNSGNLKKKKAEFGEKSQNSIPETLVAAEQTGSNKAWNEVDLSSKLEFNPTEFALSSDAEFAVEFPEKQSNKSFHAYLLGGVNTLHLKEHKVPRFTTGTELGYHFGLGVEKAFFNHRLLTRAELSFCKYAYTMIYITPLGMFQTVIWDQQQIYLPVKLGFRALNYKKLSLIVSAGGAMQFTNYIQPSIQVLQGNGTPYTDPIPYPIESTDIEKLNVSFLAEISLQYRHDKFFIEPYMTYYPQRVFAQHTNLAFSESDVGAFAKKWYTFSEMQFGLKVGF